LTHRLSHPKRSSLSCEIGDGKVVGYQAFYQDIYIKAVGKLSRGGVDGGREMAHASLAQTNSQGNREGHGRTRRHRVTGLELMHVFFGPSRCESGH
jgi:hypothetical protein